MTTIILVRHGESQANRRGIFAGNCDFDLEEKGIKQAKITARYIVENYKVDKVYTSDLKRAYKTGEIIAKEVGSPIISDSRLREIFAGKWQGIPFNTIDKEYKEEYKVWKTNSGEARCVGGESVKELGLRIMAAANEIAEKNNGKTVVIVTHATPIRTLETLIRTGNISCMKDFPFVPNASVSISTYDNGKWKMEEAGYNAHLANLMTDLPINV